MSARKVYRLPNRIFRQLSFQCLLRAVPGAVVAALPIGPWRWLGTIPILWAIRVWFIYALPKWNYQVVVDDRFILIGSKAYLWKQIGGVSLKGSGSLRILQIDVGTKKIEIPPALQGIDDLTQECLSRVKHVS